MKNTMIKLLSITFGLLFAVAAHAAGTTGDIYEILPCDRFGKTVSSPVSTIDNPVTVGETIYFKLRFMRTEAMKMAGDRWMYRYLDKSGTASEIVDNLVKPLKIGIYVSGQLDFATYVADYAVSGAEDMRDFVFCYHTKSGDFALPIRLALSNGPADSMQGASGNYVLFNNEIWGITDASGQSANYWLAEETYIGVTLPSGTRQMDYSLSKAGFYLRGIDFDSSWEKGSASEVSATDPAAAYWRSVHANSSVSVLDPKVVAGSALTNVVSLFVWTTNDAVQVKNGVEVDVTVGYMGATPITKKVKMGQYSFNPDNLSRTLDLVAGDAEGQAVDVFLSAWTDFTWNKSNELEVDYLTVPVYVTKELPSSVVVECADTTIIADGDHFASKTTLLVYLTQPATNEVKVTLKTTFECDPAKTDWNKYVRLATVKPSNDSTLPSGDEEVTLTIAPNTTTPQPVYVWALRSDEYTVGAGNQVIFTPEVSAADMAAAGIESKTTCGLYISAAKPVITAPDIETVYDVTAGEELEIMVALEDTYADMTDTNEGYTVEIKTGSTASWVTLEEKFKASGEGGELVGLTTTNAPTIKYPSSGTQTSQIRVTSPISGKKSETVSFTVNVAPAKTSSVVSLDDDPDNYVEGDTINFQVDLSADHNTGGNIYAFLLCNEDVDLSMFGGTAAKAIITNDAVAASGSVGRTIGKAATSVKSAFKVLDGLSEDAGGLNLTFSVVLCTSKAYDPTKKLDGYETTEMLNITVYNKEPLIDGVELDGGDLGGDGYYFTTQYPKGQELELQPYFTDVSYDLKHGFEYKWTAYRDGTLAAAGTVAHDTTGTATAITTTTNAANTRFETVVPDGTDISTVPFEWNFPRAGVYTVKIEAKDKDMTRYSDVTCTISFTVLNNPAVMITPKDVYQETETGASIGVGLAYFNSDDDIVVKLTVTPPDGDNPGMLKLDDSYKIVPTGYAALKDNEYYVVFNSAQTIDVGIDEMDGTTRSSGKGFKLKAEVVSEGLSPDGVTKWSEYYIADEETINIDNVAPVFGYITPANTNAWQVSGGLATSYPITWTIRSDVDSDFTEKWADNTGPGIKVTFSGCENAESFFVTQDSAWSGKFIPNFGSMKGDVNVVLTIEDKDGGLQTWTYMYKVSASKFLITASTGPYGGSSSKLSQKYANSVMDGNGAGHTWVSGGLFSSAENFQISWNCSKENFMTVYGFGYKTNTVDNGLLDGGKDIAIDVNGDNKGAPITEYYTYVDKDNKDSFFYCWVLTVEDESGTSTDSILGTIAPERPGKVASTRVPLPTEETSDGGYVDTIVEGIFAKEWLASDNLGDINQDGIPDIFAVAKWPGMNSSLIEIVSGGEIIDNDLLDISKSNPDEDYLPGVYTSQGEAALVKDSASSYAPIGLAFHSRREIRGIHTGLNATDMTVSDPDFSDVEKKAYQAFYLEQTGTEWNETNGYDLAFWSPEPSGKHARLDPTSNDTDGDDMPDGWEYFFWYQAKVWAPGGAKMGQPRAGQTYVFERFNPDNILMGTEISASSVIARFNPCEPLDTEVEGFNADFDGDGLSDLEELLIGTNPCHWDTDGDRMCDGWEVMMSVDPLNGSKLSNDDGDFMAFCNLSGFFAINTGAGIVFDIHNELVLSNDFDYVQGERLYADNAAWDAEMTIEETTEAQDENGTANYPLFYDFVGFLTLDAVDPLTGEANTEAWTLIPKLLKDVVLKRALIAMPKLDDDGKPYTYGLPGDGEGEGSHWGYPMLEMLRPNYTYKITAGTELEQFNYVLVHDQVYTAFGFDPRTGWYKDEEGYLADRWNPEINRALSPVNTTGISVNTEPYYTYDEYLVLRYRNDFNVYYPDSKGAGNSAWDNFMNNTTCPSVVYTATELDELLNSTNSVFEATEEEAGNLAVTSTIAARLAEAFAEAGSKKSVRHGHGADTDRDGAPDGWELYVYRNPNVAPGEDSGEGGDSPWDRDLDELGYAEEFAGTDSCNAYANCPSIYAMHPGNKSGWFNKFFPTDPDDPDTDGDGILDGIEGMAWSSIFIHALNEYVLGVEDPGFSFIYGNPSDSMVTCVRGGGMNPLTVDTDGDAIPDLWEMQYAGVACNAQTRKYVPPPGSNLSTDIAFSDAMFTADGLNKSGFTAPDVVYIAGGMDATWNGDAWTDPMVEGSSWDQLLGTVRDVDFDHDGLQNYQEYLMQQVRHFRYDDSLTPLNGYVYNEVSRQAEYYGYVQMNQDPDLFAANCVTTAMLVNPARNYADITNRFTVGAWKDLGYFAPVSNYWDRVVTSTVDVPYVMLPSKGTVPAIPGGTTGSYIATDPRNADTDGDGMDDYYEMFHGLNPLLGTTKPHPFPLSYKDQIYLVYGETSKMCAFGNRWTGGQIIENSSAADPIKYPWAMGAGEVDPDGDGIRNDNERLSANLASPENLHTDPTPLWFTDSSSPSSFVSQYYGLTGPIIGMPWWPGLTMFDDPYSMPSTYGGVGYPLFISAFEENEGYDTDNDWKSDGREIVSTVSIMSDPLDFTDPSRRQALYLNGTDSFAMTRYTHYRCCDAVDFFKQFTVEAWVRPETQGRAQTILERSVEYGYSALNKDDYAIRANFRIGLDAEGRIYGLFDNSDAVESGANAGVSCQTVTGPKLELGKWSHIALTFDGKQLTLYVDGVAKTPVLTSLIPANGVMAVLQDPVYPDTFTAYAYSALPAAFFIGARPQKATSGSYALGLSSVDYGNLREYFHGYVDEVRVWDGARTAGEIAANYKRAMTIEEVSENREEIYTHLMSAESDSSRNDNDGLNNLPAELVQHYNFSTLPGAIEPGDVAITPSGFQKGVFDQTASADSRFTGNIGWWDECKTKSKVYTDYRVLPWIENTVHHLPVMDGSVVDSFLYSEYLGGYYTQSTNHGIAKYTFPNSAMPYQYYMFSLDRYQRLFCLNQMIDANPDSTLLEDVLLRYRYEVRSDLIGTTDLIPMGGAFAKTCPAMWDGNGVADAWEYSGSDTDADGLPDWWETKYGLDTNSEYDWNKTVNWNGVELPANIAFGVDLALGMKPDGNYDPQYVNKADLDGDNIPDWWEELFGVAKYGSDDDPDKDGLPNYAEYLISFGPYPYGITNGWHFVSPVNAYSTSVDQKVPDYYLRAPKAFDDNGRHVSAKEYFGEIFTDHDFMETWWESSFSKAFTNPYAYDPGNDTDGDGWDNFSENRAATWYGTIMSDTITKYLSDEVLLKNYPQPALGIRFTYNGDQDVSGAAVVVRTMTTPSGRTDATFTVTAPGSEQVGSGVYAPGAFIDSETPLHGLLQPGSVIPSGCYVYGTRLSKEGVYYWGISKEAVESALTAGTAIGSKSITCNCGDPVDCWYCTGTFDEYVVDMRNYGRSNVLLDNPAVEFEMVGRAVSRDDGVTGDIMIASPLTTLQSVFGTIDFSTGEFTLEPDELAKAGLAPDGMLLKLEYTYAISTEWPQTLWLNQPSKGRVLQGENTIEAWLDLDGNGAYTAGEPYGVARGVNVGWHRTAETVIELKDTSSIVPHYLLADGSNDRTVIEGASGGVTPAAAAAADGITADIVVRRVGINGERSYGTKTVPQRILVAKTYTLDDRAYLTEADVLSEDKFDLDWKWLISDARKLGLSGAEIETVEYEIAKVNSLPDGSVTNITLATFVNTYNSQRSIPVARAPIAAAPVYSAAPELSWSCDDDTMTAFRLQVSTSTNTADVIYDSGIRQLPGRDSLTADVNVYSFTPELYIGTAVATNGAAVFLDGSNYFWRVTQYNAKYNTEEKSGWSAWAKFQMDVANNNRYPITKTGFGRCGAVVRYFGPNTNDLEGIVVVEAHASADFAGQPLAQIRADISQLDDINDITTVNAAFAGLEPGAVYLMAYIDSDNNGRRDANEAWGYANYIGSSQLAIFQPLGITVTDELYLAGEPPKTVIYIEDTDVNGNEIPDCLETYADGETETAGDTDRDGIADADESGYATDAAVWDTDADGMPDGWEAKFADLDPNFEDAGEAVEHDVMAFVEIGATAVTVQNTDGSEPVMYILKSDKTKPLVGDSIDAYDLYELYDYPIAVSNEVEAGYARGKAVKLTAAAGTTNRVIAVSDIMVSLVHAQVYDEFGFNPKTANAAAYKAGDAVNTKEFTALDKYLLIRYLETFGVCDEESVNIKNEWAKYSLKPLDADNDRDGLADGWELYVMFGKNGCGKVEAGGAVTDMTSLSQAKISPWNFNDRFDDLDGDGHSNVKENGDGETASDPWNAYSVYEKYLEDGLLLPGTPKFNDSAVKSFGISNEEMAKDGDGDLVTGLQEFQAYYYDTAALKDLSPTNAWSDGTMPDYFRAMGTTYIGAYFNGGEFIEPSARTALGITTFKGIGTRDYDHSGWDFWSTARYSLLNMERTVNIEGVVSDELMLLIRYWNVIRPGEFEGTTVQAAMDFFHEIWGGVIRLIDDEGNVLIEVKNGGVSGFGTIHHADAAQTTTQVVAFFGGQKKMEEIIALNKKDITSEEIVTPEPEIDLAFRYAGDDSCNIILEAHQTSLAYPELGEQLTAKWNITVKFAAGVAQTSVNVPTTGTLVQGQVRFIAYIDADGDGKRSPNEAWGTTDSIVGYLGASEVIRLSSGNDALPVLTLDDAAVTNANVIQTIAIVRTKVNGEYVTPRGVMLLKYDNNVNREAVYPAQYIGDNGKYIGIDKYLALESEDELDPAEDDLASVESVTYEIVKLARSAVEEGDGNYCINATNLNHYTFLEEIEDAESGTVSNAYYIVDQQLNEEFTVRYSITRDIPLEVKGEASSTEDETIISFTVPTDRAVTKFWLDIPGIATSDAGYILDNAAGGRVVLDGDWFTKNNIAFAAGEYKVRVALGNDKFPAKPADAAEWSATAEFNVAEGAAFDGKLAVKVVHPCATLDAGKLTVAVYEKADLAMPVRYLTGQNALETIEIGGLRENAEYYIAAWYVKDDADGRSSDACRMPYDTWGYSALLNDASAGSPIIDNGFNPLAHAATAQITVTNLVCLQDTDWNANGKIDRDEAIKSVTGTTSASAPAWNPLDVDGDGIPDYDDDDPVFDSSLKAKEGDVMAYARVQMLTVMIGTMDDATNWVKYVVYDPENEPTADKLQGETVIIPRGTAASELKSLYTTYLYGNNASAPTGIGTNVTLAAGKVYAYEWEDITLVHHQVYQRFGFNPETANAFCTSSNWVNTAQFKAKDKYLVTNYLAAVGALAPDAVHTNWTLRAKCLDFDYDGITDGWELYTMFGDNASQQLGKNPKVDVINAWCAEDRNLDADGDGLTNLHEYDGGNNPTDPWNADTDGDGIGDALAYDFHLKGSDGKKDLDGDGLSNYIEYLLNKVFNIGDFRPDNAFSLNANVSDYFFKMGELYVGEVFTDHDHISAQWESSYLSVNGRVSPYQYDSVVDVDGDGWDNYSEYQAGTDPTKVASVGIDAVQIDEFPIPTVEFTITYRGEQNIADIPIVVKAWSEETDEPVFASIPDAIWTIGGGETKQYEGGGSNVVSGVRHLGINPGKETLSFLSPGSVVVGSVKFEFKDLAWVLFNPTLQMAMVSDPVTAQWQGFVIDRQRSEEVDKGDLVVQTTGDVIGTIDYVTGAVNIDFTRLPETVAVVGDISGSFQGTDWLSVYNLETSYIRISWQSKPVTGGSESTYFLSEPDKPSPENNSRGHLKQGDNTFIAFYDFDGNGMYTIGEPYGFARGVDVGWNYSKLAVELTDTSPVFARYNITDAGASSGATTDREVHFPDAPDVVLNPEGANIAPVGKVRVRVLRFAVDSFAEGGCLGSYCAIVYDRMLDTNEKNHPTITEADILSMPGNEFDLDWNAKENGVPENINSMNLDEVYEDSKGVELGDGTKLVMTNVYYTVHVGNDPIEALVLSNSTVLAKVICRKFDLNRQQPIPVSPGEDGGSIVNTVSPVFTWNDGGYDTYTAFRIRITGGGVNWTSDYQLMPAKDSDGNHRWTAPLRAGAVVPGTDVEFKNGETYTWQISTYNAKFKSDSWKSGGQFKMNVIDDSLDYGVIKTAIRYYGPAAVASSGPIRVQAFTTPDFSGTPVAEGYVKDVATVSNTVAIAEGNAELIGLLPGTYYLRAFIDTEKDGVCAPWESYGYYCTRNSETGMIFTPLGVTVGTVVGASETVDMYIEDCDIDQDCLPDAWEWVQEGDLETMGVSSLDQSAAGFVMNKDLTGAIISAGQTSSGLAVMMKSVLSSPRVAALLLGVEATGSDEDVVNALVDASENVEIEEESVAITGITLDTDNRQVKLDVGADVSTKVSESLASSIYTFSGADQIDVVCRVMRKATLMDAEWKEVATKEVTISTSVGIGSVIVDLGDEVDLSSGFFKVVLEQK